MGNFTRKLTPGVALLLQILQLEEGGQGHEGLSQEHVKLHQDQEHVDKTAPDAHS